MCSFNCVLDTAGFVLYKNMHYIEVFQVQLHTCGGRILETTLNIHATLSSTRPALIMTLELTLLTASPKAEHYLCQGKMYG